VRGADVELIKLSRYYGEVAAIRGVDLHVHAGEFLTLLGPSGSGKTTTLMAVAGFVEPSEGDIRIDGRSVRGLPPDRRNLGVVFQSYALFPHMSVFENVAFPLRMRRMGRAAIAERVGRTLELVQLGRLGERRIQQISGGQQQRVALARALVFEPPVLLMDEPLGALDRKLREQMQLEIKRLQRSLGLTVLYVTHDQEEALVLSDRVAVLNEGLVHQVGSPAEVYERPATAFVAAFVGESNFLAAVAEAVTPDRVTLRVDGLERPVHAPAAAVATGQPVRVMVRPEAVRLGPPDAGAGADNALPGRIEEVVYLGQAVRYLVRVGGLPLVAREPHRGGEPIRPVGAAVTASWPVAAAVVVPG
jgi:spermidine/putrescine ABC transporter ATP-binding subunit